MEIFFFNLLHKMTIKSNTHSIKNITKHRCKNNNCFLTKHSITGNVSKDSYVTHDIVCMLTENVIRVIFYLCMGGQSDIYCCKYIYIKDNLDGKINYKDYYILKITTDDTISNELFFINTVLNNKIDNVINIYDVGSIKYNDKLTFMTLPLYCNDMHRLVVKNKLQYKDIISCILTIAETIDKLHDNDVLHLDIKPSNILVHSKYKNILEYYLSDFGLSSLYFNDNDAKIIKKKRLKNIIGTPVYMSHEQHEGYSRKSYSSDYISFYYTTLFLISKRALIPWYNDKTKSIYTHKKNYKPKIFKNVYNIILNTKYGEKINLYDIYHKEIIKEHIILKKTFKDNHKI